jgi:hypothetical protein
VLATEDAACTGDTTAAANANVNINRGKNQDRFIVRAPFKPACYVDTVSHAVCLLYTMIHKSHRLSIAVGASIPFTDKPIRAFGDPAQHKRTAWRLKKQW